MELTLFDKVRSSLVINGQWWVSDSVAFTIGRAINIYGEKHKERQPKVSVPSGIYIFGPKFDYLKSECAPKIYKNNNAGVSKVTDHDDFYFQIFPDIEYRINYKNCILGLQLTEMILLVLKTRIKREEEFNLTLVTLIFNYLNLIIILL